MTQRDVWSFGGHEYRVRQRDLGAGGQGAVHLAHRVDDAASVVIIKDLPKSAENQARTGYLLNQRVGHSVPGVCGPLAQADQDPDGRIWYLAPFSPGVPLEEDRPRSLAELLEMAVLLACTWQRLEESGIAHGDIAPSNILIRDDGQPDLIDLDNFGVADPGVASASMIGQHAMLAPELRQARNSAGTGANVAPGTETDRFAWGILFNLLLLGRHPADGLAQTPKEFDAHMMSGHWLEELRTPEPGEVPVHVLGQRLIELFRASASVDPGRRPGAKQWREGLLHSLGRLHTHCCGGAFVVDQSRGQCPWCGDRLHGSSFAPRVMLQVKNTRTGAEQRLALEEGGFVYLGRETLPGLSSFVSSRQVRLYRQAERLYVEHVGQNQTTIRLGGERKTYALRSYQDRMDSPSWNGAVLTLADTPVELRIVNESVGS